MTVRLRIQFLANEHHCQDLRPRRPYLALKVARLCRLIQCKNEDENEKDNLDLLIEETAR